MESIEKRLRILEGKQDHQDAEMSEAVMNCITGGNVDIQAYGRKASDIRQKIGDLKGQYLDAIRELSQCHRDAAEVAWRVIRHGGEPVRLDTLNWGMFDIEDDIPKALSPVVHWAHVSAK